MIGGKRERPTAAGLTAANRPHGNVDRAGHAGLSIATEKQSVSTAKAKSGGRCALPAAGMGLGGNGHRTPGCIMVRAVHMFGWRSKVG